MIRLDDLNDYLWMIAWAAFFGALGGLAASIIASRQSAANEKPADATASKTTTQRVLDLGPRALGSVFLGAVAAVISLYFLAPITTTITDGVSVQEYNVVQLVALALVVGAAGETVIASAQARVVAAIQTEKTQAAIAVGEAQVEEVGQAAIAITGRLAGGAPSAAFQGPGNEPSGMPAVQDVEQEMREQIESAKRTIRAVAG
jgi:hypothetical protein